MLNILFLFFMAAISPHEQIPKSEMGCIIRQLRPSIKENTISMVVDAVKEGAQSYDVDEPLILAFIKTESDFRHISNKNLPYDTGMLQVLPYDTHIRHFLWINSGKNAKKRPLSTLRGNPKTAIIAGIYEMAWWELQMEISRQMRRLYKKLPSTLKSSLGKYKFIPFYNWGPTLYIGKTSIAAGYPYRILRNLHRVRKHWATCRVMIKKNVEAKMPNNTSDSVPNGSFALITISDTEEAFLTLMEDSGDVSKEELSATIWQLGFMALLNETESMIEVVLDDETEQPQFVELKRLAKVLKDFYADFIS